MRKRSLTRRCRRAVAAVAVALVAVPVMAIEMPSATAAAPVPTVTGPITGGTHGFPLGTSALDLATLGYTEQEYFFEGTASAYTAATPLGSDGKWTATAAGTAPYKSRMLVRKPAPDKFNGTVIVEWYNVTGGLDAGAAWAQSHSYLVANGYAWVGVSAQVVGIDGFPAGNPLGNSGALKIWDAARYGSLSHPGDSYSYDIFSQAGQALRTPGAVNPLAGLTVTKLVASGESQSAGRLTTYVNAVHPLVHVYDGYFIYSRSRTGAMLSQTPLTAIAAPSPTFIRDDIDVPVLVFETETDVTGHASARQADSAKYRLWEVAGTAHYDEYGLSKAASDYRAAGIRSDALVPCGYRINTTLGHYALAAAVDQLNKWVNTGTAPASAPRLELDAASMIVRDSFGNARGGIRLPQIAAPIATITGQSGGGPIFCTLFGRTTPFTAAQIAALYPTAGSYMTQFNAATDAAAQAGHVLAADVAEIKARAVEDVFNLGDATFAGSTRDLALNAAPVGIAATPSGNGYWEIAADGGVFSYGDAKFFGSMGGIRLNGRIVGAVSTPSGNGYWFVAEDGGVFSFGDAKFFGSMGGIPLNKRVVGIARTPTGNGYYLVAEDGGIFAFGDAKFSGSAANLPLVSPVAGLAADPDGTGYWLVAGDGGVFSYDAPFLGSSAEVPRIEDVVVGIAATPGRGYWIAYRSGQVFDQGDAPNVNDAVSNGRDVTGIASTPTGRGYWLSVAPAP
jgi:hypothetical protein